MSEVLIERAAKRDLKRIVSGQERDHVVSWLRRLAEDAPNLDIEPIAGAAPGWFRLRISECRILYYRSRLSDPTGPTTFYAIERIVTRSNAAALWLPEER